VKKNNSAAGKSLPKTETGIKGLDEITFGGLPEGRPTLICGSAGSGKTLFGLEFLYHGATRYNEPGAFISFEESPEELIANVSSLGFNFPELIKKKLIAIDYVHVEKSEIEITGEFDLEGLFIRLGYVIDSIGAKRIVLDTIESLFSGIENHAILRAELRRLFRWLKSKGVTAIITGERGDQSLTRQGLEEYVSDCVILLDHRIADQYGTRRMRIVKYRGSFHGTNEYPFIIKEQGLSIIPISSLTLDHRVSKERISSGVPTLDEMFEGKGFYKGTTILISGTAGTGKSSLLSSFVNEICSNGGKALYIALEESKNQIIRNMNSIGINLKQWEDKGLLKFHVTRPTYHSLEMHLALIQEMVKEYKPSAVVVDPVTNFTSISSVNETNALLTRLIDFFKQNEISTMLASLTEPGVSMEKTDVGISSLVDTWILLRELEMNGERNRTLYILKSRGMKHSNQVREFQLSKKGIHLIDVFISKEGVLLGSARDARIRLESELKRRKAEEKKNMEQEINRLENSAANRIEEIKAEYKSKAKELKNKFESKLIEEETLLSTLKFDAEKRQDKLKIKTDKENGR
jgi:circadian clock protein KaiC